MQITFSAGQHVSKAAEQLVQAANEHGSAEGKFNDIVLRAERGTLPQDVVAAFNRQSAERAEAYRASPAGIAAAQTREQHRAGLQARHDNLMKRLPTLDFGNKLAVIEWLCAMQEPSDRVGVIVRKATIVAAFAKHGYEPNANCGDDYREDNCGNVFRYLVGQALSGLTDGPAIHSIIHKFADEWRTKFSKELS